MNIKTIALYTIITIVIVLTAMVNATLMQLAIAIAFVVTTLFEFSEDWSLGLIEFVGTVLLGLSLGNAVGVTGFIISMGVSIYGGIVFQWFIMKHYPWLSSNYRKHRRASRSSK